MSKLSVNNLSCQRGYNLLFENLSFELNSGEILRISGQNGSGKTSLLKIIAGLNTPELGSIEFDHHQSNSEKYQIETLYLGQRLSLLRSAQIFAGITFLFNIMTLVSIYIENQDLAQILFACAVIAMMSSISIYLVEIIITVRAVGYLVKKIIEKRQPTK